MDEYEYLMCDEHYLEYMFWTQDHIDDVPDDVYLKWSEEWNQTKQFNILIFLDMIKNIDKKTLIDKIYAMSGNQNIFDNNKDTKAKALDDKYWK